MTQSELQARIDAMMDAEYEALGGDNFRKQFGDKAVKRIITKRFTERLKAEVESDAEFNAAYLLHVAHRHCERWDAEHRPIGAYRKDGVLKLNEQQRVFMRDAKRDHLLAWALHEDDERNLAYIKSRLDLWDAHPECKTLAELESKI